MNIPGILERQPDFPKEKLGYAQVAFFGGRASAHIRKQPVPVVHTDFLAMYPTVNILMGLWPFFIAKKVSVIENCRSEMTQLLSSVSVEDLFRQDTWKFLTAFVKVLPNGDILPSRAKYSVESNDWQVGSNYLYADPSRPDEQAIWVSLPDAIASRILTGRAPKILDAFRIAPEGVLPGLKPIRFWGQTEIDPAKDDLFKVAIERRKLLAADDPLGHSLKVFVNSMSYGVNAEMNRDELEDKAPSAIYGLDPRRSGIQRRKLKSAASISFRHWQLCRLEQRASCSRFWKSV